MPRFPIRFPGAQLRSMVFSLSCLALCATVLPARAQKATDPLSGIWTGEWGTAPNHRHKVTVELKWDGKTLKGTVNPGPRSVKLQKTSFDPATGLAHFEAYAGDMGKPPSHYVIDGKLEDGTLIGTWSHPKRKGDFKLVKKR